MLLAAVCIYNLLGPGTQPPTVRTSGTSVNEELTSFPAVVSFPIIDDDAALETVERYLFLITSDPSFIINPAMSEIVILDDDGKFHTLK